MKTPILMAIAPITQSQQPGMLLVDKQAKKSVLYSTTITGTKVPKNGYSGY